LTKFLIAGLGNPGSEYSNTRHNIGFKVLDALAAQKQAEWELQKYGHVSRFTHKGKSFILLKPDTYMNLSGKAVQYWMQKEKTNLQQLLVVTDDLALPTGKLRLKLKGNDGGHNGLKSINETLGTQDYPRLRYGIGNDFPRGRQVEFVLGNWEESEKEIVEQGIQSAVEAIIAFALEGPGKAMTKFNA